MADPPSPFTAIGTVAMYDLPHDFPPPKRGEDDHERIMQDQDIRWGPGRVRSPASQGSSGTKKYLPPRNGEYTGDSWALYDLRTAARARSRRGY